MNTFLFLPTKFFYTIFVSCVFMFFICNALHAAETNPAKTTKNAKTITTPVISAAKTVKVLTNSVSASASTNTTALMLPKLVDLGAKKCIPCKKLAPILEELKKDYAGALTVEFIDVWLKENAGQAEKYGIDTIPTQIFFDPQGKELWRHVGFISKEDILAQWKKLGYELKPKKENTGSTKNATTSKN
jgi:thioredoxin 1